MIEILTRLGFALLLSVGLALLLAWGWDHSDGAPAQPLPVAGSTISA
ncbi:MAG: hypothetical protein WCZ20_05645 [Hydrogenophaga sp.]|nr:hypothetical protein [Hydrogenophaga sp.]MDD3784222.1 hypothetical protein [Hydrogenophaga sp.]MDX9967855.1 hypothetical protein [Hydrogenophaga sp.]